MVHLRELPQRLSSLGLVEVIPGSAISPGSIGGGRKRLTTTAFGDKEIPGSV
jgi:hypothetical protein